MTTLQWDGEYFTLKKLFPIKNAIKSVEFNRITKNLLLHLSSGDRKVEVGQTITKDEDGNVS